MCLPGAYWLPNEPQISGRHTDQKTIQKQNGEPCWIRTSDLLIKSQLLYRLS